MLATDTLASGPTNVTLDESGISWQSDRDVKFKNVDGFAVRQVDASVFAAWGTDAAGTCTAESLATGTTRLDRMVQNRRTNLSSTLYFTNTARVVLCLLAASLGTVWQLDVVA